MKKYKTTYEMICLACEKMVETRVILFDFFNSNIADGRCPFCGERTYSGSIKIEEVEEDDDERKR